MGGNAELVEDARNGYLVDIDDDDAAAQKILRLLDAPELSQTMGSYGLRIVQEQFTETAMISRLVDSYEHLLAERMREVPGGTPVRGWAAGRSAPK